MIGQGAIGSAAAPATAAAPRRFALLGPALRLTAGRALAYGAAFLVPVVLARAFTAAEFGTYKQLFLIYGFVYLVGQVGLATSLYYFLPRSPADAGRYVANATLLLIGAGALSAAIVVSQPQAVTWLLGNPALEPYLGELALYLALTLVASPLEVLLICRRSYRGAAWAFAVTDLARAVLLVGPVLITGELRALVLGAVAFGGLRLGAYLFYLHVGVPGPLRPDRRLAREQLAYSLPFGSAVLVGMLQLYFHQFVVSHWFDAATFAIYAVGCLQVPLVDFLATPTGDVMMVRMSEARRERRERDILAIWHDGVVTMSLLLVPLVGVLLAVAEPLILVLFTSRYAASVPIFELWALAILSVPLLTDCVLRVYAQTRYLLVMYLVQLAAIAVLIRPLLDRLGLPGAVLATLGGLVVARLLALVRIGRRLGVGVGRLLPWSELARIAAAAALAWAVASVTGAALTLAPVAKLALVGTAYVLVYAALVVWWRVAPRAELAGLLRRLRSPSAPNGGVESN